MTELARTIRRRGRPALPSERLMVQISLRLPQELLADVDRFRREARYGAHDRASVIREAIGYFLADQRRIALTRLGKSDLPNPG